MRNVVDPGVLEALGTDSTCVVASAVETFDLRLRNVGFADGSIRSVLGDLPPVVGYAATARVRSAEPPMEGGNYYDRSAWWSSILEIPAPRIVVLEDVDQPAGIGAFIGEVHARVLQALQCVGVVTNGAVRDLTDVRRIGFQLFASHVAISHAYAHILDFGRPVEVGHLRVEPGDLIHADVHGVLSIPLAIAPQIPAAIRAVRDRRRQVAALCAANDFSFSALKDAAPRLGLMRT
jgi:4-hydroxy-4-methyl-2-oxoglutarate aldolase